MEGIVLREADHKHIFDSRYTPTTQLLVKQLLNFYFKQEQLNPNGDGCCAKLDESFQRARNGKSEAEQSIK